MANTVAKYQQYAEYKDSGIDWLGEIPTTWSIFRGKYVCTEFNERSETGEETLLSVSEYYGIKPRAEKISEGDFLSRAESLEGYKKCYPNDLVMNIMLAWKKGLGVTKYEGIVSPAYSVFRFKSHIDADYMHYLLRTNQYIDHFKTRSTGVIDSRLRLYPDSFADVSILTPPKNEQTQIANFLDHETTKIDSLIEKQQQLIQLLKEKRQAVISHAVTKGLNPNVSMKDSGVEWLGQVPEHWGVSSIGYYAKVTNGTTPSKANLSYWDKAEIPWLSSGEVNQYYIVEASEYITTKALAECSLELLPIGTVVMGMIGQGKTRGLSAITKMEATINQNLAALVAYPKLNNEYLHYYLQAAYDYMREEGRGGNQAALNCEIIRKFPITISSYQEQLQIVEQIKKLSITYKALINKAESAIQLIQERRTALISAAVTGKIDVRNWQNPNNNNEAKTELSA